ncbi:hypothetical protein ACHAWF_017825 [Thalassiosira exigua]
MQDVKSPLYVLLAAAGVNFMMGDVCMVHGPVEERLGGRGGVGDRGEPVRGAGVLRAPRPSNHPLPSRLGPYRSPRVPPLRRPRDHHLREPNLRLRRHGPRRLFHVGHVRHGRTSDRLLNLLLPDSVRGYVGASGPEYCPGGVRGEGAGTGESMGAGAVGDGRKLLQGGDGIRSVLGGDGGVSAVGLTVLHDGSRGVGTGAGSGARGGIVHVGERPDVRGRRHKAFPCGRFGTLSLVRRFSLSHCIVMPLDHPRAFRHAAGTEGPQVPAEHVRRLLLCRADVHAEVEATGFGRSRDDRDWDDVDGAVLVLQRDMHVDLALAVGAAAAED